MDFSSNALCAKAKALYGNRLTREEYEDMCRKVSVSELVVYLKSQTSYSESLNDINVRNVHRGQLEMALNKEYYIRSGKLFKYAPAKDREFYRFELVSAEIKIIVEKLMSLKNNEMRSFDLEIPSYLTTKTTFNVYGLINIDNYKDLVKYLKNTRYYGVLSKYESEQMIDVNSIQHELKKLYYDGYVDVIKKRYKGETQKDLLNVLYTSIELENIVKIYRLKKYFNETPDFIRSTLFLEYSRLPKNVMETLINASGEKELMTLLANSKYSLYLDDNDYPYIEYYVENIRYNIAKRYMRFSGEAPLVFLTYCILQKIEVDNLKHIVEGIRYGRDGASIEKTLIYA